MYRTFIAIAIIEHIIAIWEYFLVEWLDSVPDIKLNKWQKHRTTTTMRMATIGKYLTKKKNSNKIRLFVWNVFLLCWNILLKIGINFLKSIFFFEKQFYSNCWYLRLFFRKNSELKYLFYKSQIKGRTKMSDQFKSN